MQLVKKGSEFKTQKAQGQNRRQTWTRLVIVLGLAIFYIIIFHPLIDIVGPVGAALVSVPVGFASWYFGIRTGLISGFLGIVLNALLLVKFQGNTFFTWLVMGWPGNIMVLAVGYLASVLGKELAERSRVGNELQSRERFLVLISMATKSILDPKNPEDAYYHLLTHLSNLFVADYAYLTGWDETRKQAILIASTKSPGQQTMANIILEPDETAMIESVLQTGRIMVIDDVPNSQYIINPAIFRKHSLETQTALCIPLIMKGYKFGAVTVAFDTPRLFTSEELTYAELASNQIALALWTFEQDLKISKRLKEANALANIERALSETERVGIETVLQLIVDSAKELLPKAKNAILHLLDEEQAILIPRAVAGVVGESKSKLNMRLGEGVAGQVISMGETISISDIRADYRFLNQAIPVKFRSLIVAPVKSNERRVGTISVQSDETEAFSPEEINLLGALGTQAAIAIENANLLETTKQNLKEINALYQISRGMAASLDSDQLMKDSVDLLQKNFGYYHAQIFIVDPISRDLVAYWGSGKIGSQLKEQGFFLPNGAGIVGHVAETVNPFVTNNVNEVIFFVRDPLLPNTQSELAVPIKIENQVLGVLDIQQALPDHLSSHDMQLMMAVADQLAVALQKANLYAELQNSLRQEKATRSQLIQSERLAIIGRLLASVSHELNNPLQAIQNALFLLKGEKGISGQGQQDLEIVLSETERMSMLIERLRSAYRPSRTEDLREVQINNLIEEVYALVATHMRHREITFEFHPDPDLPSITGVSDQLRQVILNLFINSVEAMPSGGHIIVHTRQLLERDSIMFSVEDTGPGIDPEILPHIFEPFITGKETGTGLGLTISHDIIHQHQGDIRAENNPDCGATFKVWLPLYIKSLV